MMRLCMSRLVNKSILIVLCLAVLLAATARAGIEAGAGLRVITPDPLLPVSGGMGPTSPAREKRGDLTARAMVFQRDDVRVAIVSVDLLGFPSVLCARARRLVPRIPTANILIGATHTHSAPDCYAFPDGQGGHTGDLAYMDMVCRKIAEAVGEAVDNLRPAQVKVATGQPRGKIAYNYYAPDLYDRRASVLGRHSRRRDDRHAGQLRRASRGPRRRRRDLEPRSSRADARANRIPGRRHGDLHDGRPGRHGHGRQPRP